VDRAQLEAFAAAVKVGGEGSSHQPQPPRQRWSQH
jgi:hypothetical protein